MFKFLENLFKDDIKESIIDIPRRIYAPGVFDDADTDNPKLKPVVLDMIKDQLKDFERLAPVVRYSLIGSILTKRYRNDADLDINVLFDVPESEQEEKRLEFSKELKGINGRLVPGTHHPINYLIITDQDSSQHWYVSNTINNGITVGENYCYKHHIWEDVRKKNSE